MATPRGIGSLKDAGRHLVNPVRQVQARILEERLPERPLVGADNDVHGVLVLGGKGAGKTSLLISLLALAQGHYPKKSDAGIEDKKKTMPQYGQCYDFPERDVKFFDGSLKPMRLVLTDTPACGTQNREENPLCANVSPNSAQHFHAVPAWMRMCLRSGNYPHYSVIFVVDATAQPLWEDTARCQDLVRLLAVLKKSRYTVVIAVTKLLKARLDTQREINYGGEHGGKVGKDPRSCYEAYAARYMDKVCAAIQAKAAEHEWSFSQGPDAPEFPLSNVTIFDAPTWESPVDYKKWQDLKLSSEAPNGRYYNFQLNKLLLAASVRMHPE
jgi:hypothetical protein